MSITVVYHAMSLDCTCTVLYVHLYFLFLNFVCVACQGILYKCIVVSLHTKKNLLIYLLSISGYYGYMYMYILMEVKNIYIYSLFYKIILSNNIVYKSIFIIHVYNI